MKSHIPRYAKQQLTISARYKNKWLRQKSELPVHVILVISDYTKFKTQERAMVGLSGEPIAESTKLRWF